MTVLRFEPFEQPEIDFDGDGELGCEDCNDTEPDISSLESELCGDGVDNNCDGQIDEGCSS